MTINHYVSGIKFLGWLVFLVLTSIYNLVCFLLFCFWASGLGAALGAAAAVLFSQYRKDMLLRMGIVLILGCWSYLSEELIIQILPHLPVMTCFITLKRKRANGYKKFGILVRLV